MKELNLFLLLILENCWRAKAMADVHDKKTLEEYEAELIVRSFLHRNGFPCPSGQAGVSAAW